MQDLQLAVLLLYRSVTTGGLSFGVPHTKSYAKEGQALCLIGWAKDLQRKTDKSSRALHGDIFLLLLLTFKISSIKINDGRKCRDNCFVSPVVVLTTGCCSCLGQPQWLKRTAAGLPTYRRTYSS